MKTVWVIMCATHSQEDSYDYVESIWTTRKRAEEEIAALKKESPYYCYPHKNYSVIECSVKE